MNRFESLRPAAARAAVAAHSSKAATAVRPVRREAAHAPRCRGPPRSPSRR